MTEGERTYTDKYGYEHTVFDPTPCAPQWTHDGVTYKGCAYATGATYPWCATLVDSWNVYVKGNRGFCKMRSDGGYCDLFNECTTDGRGGSGHLKKCIFPWTYNGMTYDGCANPNNANNLWCATKVYANSQLVEEEWGYCKMENDGGFCKRQGLRECKSHDGFQNRK